MKADVALTNVATPCWEEERLLAAMSAVQNQIKGNQQLRVEMASRSSGSSHECKAAKPVVSGASLQPSLETPPKKTVLFETPPKNGRPSARSECKERVQQQEQQAVEHLREREEKVEQRERQILEQEGVLEKRRHSLFLLAQNLKNVSVAGDITCSIGDEEKEDEDFENDEDGDSICGEYDCDWNQCVETTED